MALIDTVRTGERTVEGLKTSIDTLPRGSALGVQLQSLVAEGESDVAAFREAVEGWFDDAMDRVSGWYKRWSQKLTIVFAIAVTIAFNASAVRIVERLDAEPAVRAAVVTQAEKAVEAGRSGAPTTPKEAGEQIKTAYTDLEELKLPLMWSGENVPWASGKAALLTFIGWVLTAFALSLGAPFWFDALGKLSRLRSTGKRPEEASAGKP